MHVVYHQSDSTLCSLLHITHLEEAPCRRIPAGEIPVANKIPVAKVTATLDIRVDPSIELSFIQ